MVVFLWWCFCGGVFVVVFLGWCLVVVCCFAGRRHSAAFGCDKAMRSPQRRTHCRATKFFGVRMRRRQCVAHSGVRTAEQRNSSACGCDEGNTRPTAARALQRDEILQHSEATNAIRNPQRHAPCSVRTRRRQCVTDSGVRAAEQRNSLIHGYPVML